jgi:hypothetical protein
MTACENVLFIHTDSNYKKEYFIGMLNESIVLFETFVTLNGSRYECYGTSSDVYIEYIDIKIEDDVITLLFYTYDNPCIEFCKKFAAKYSISVQLTYYNEESGYSGKLDIYRNQVVRNERCSYWQGMYMYSFKFWENIYRLFENEIDFMEMIKKNNLHILNEEFLQLKRKFDEYILCKGFEKM